MAPFTIFAVLLAALACFVFIGLLVEAIINHRGWLRGGIYAGLAFVAGIVFLTIVGLYAYNHGYITNPFSSTSATCTDPATAVTWISDQVVYVDLRNGDQVMTAVTIVRPLADTSAKTLIVVTDPGMAMDVTYPVMIFSSYMLEGTPEQVQCFVSNLGIKNSVKVYISRENTAPFGYSTLDEVTGWWESLTLRTYDMSTPHIDSGKAIPQFIPRGSPEDARTIQTEVGDFNHGQMWFEDGKTVDYEVAEGYRLIIPQEYEGTNFFYDSPSSTIQDSVLQASIDTVEQDKIWSLTMLYCGDPANVPTTVLDATYLDANGSPAPTHSEWVTSLSGWKCEKVSE